MILVSFFEIFASIRVLKISKSPLSRCRACPCIALLNKAFLTKITYLEIAARGHLKTVLTG